MCGHDERARTHTHTSLADKANFGLIHKEESSVRDNKPDALISELHGCISSLMLTSASG